MCQMTRMRKYVCLCVNMKDFPVLLNDTSLVILIVSNDKLIGGEEREQESES